MTRFITPTRACESEADTDLLPVLLSDPEGKRPRRLRILHVFDRLHLGGTEKIILKLVNGLSANHFEHLICTTRGVGASATSWAAGIEVLQAGGSETAKLQFNVLRLATLMRKVRPTIVHSRAWGGIEAVFAARLAKVPVVIHSEHGYQLEMLAGLALRQRMLRHLAYRCATAVFTVTEELRSYHAAQAWVDPKAIRVLYNGVDGETFKPQPQVRIATRRQLNIPVDRFVVGFVGRMVPLKDAITLLKAVEALVASRPDIHALLVGSGPELARLKEYVSRSPRLNGRVTFPGTTDNVADMLNAMDVFVLPSLKEGMSNTLLEALASGLPVIATRVGGNPEIIEEEVCGYLFTPGDAEDLSGKLAALLRNHELQAQFGLSAREKALGQFSLDCMLSRYSDLYVGLAESRTTAPVAGAYVRN